MACQRCYPRGKSDFIITYCGEFRSEEDRVDDVLSTGTVCKKCRIERAKHFKSCRGTPDLFTKKKDENG